MDDDEDHVRLIEILLGGDGYTVQSAGSGGAAMRSVAERAPDVILLDIGLPDLNGYQVCRRLKADATTRLIPVVFLSGLDVFEARMAAIKAGAQEFLSKPFDCEELRARVRSLVRLKHQTDELESAESVIMSLALIVEARDEYTSGHCARMAAYATIFGAALGMPIDVLETLRRGAYLHDVGKVGIPDSVLLKQLPLTAPEFAVMQRHTIIGDALCGNMRSLAPLRPIVRQHHERLDGSGYPDGLAGDDVHFLAQIVGICDAYDAMTTTRPYRDALGRGDACRELLEDGRRGKLNAAFVDTFVGLLMNDHFSSRTTS